MDDRKKKIKERAEGMGMIVCDCGYNNKKENVAIYGTCRGWGKVLDEKAKYKHEMFLRLKMWKGKRWI